MKCKQCKTWGKNEGEEMRLHKKKSKIMLRLAQRKKQKKNKHESYIFRPRIQYKHKLRHWWPQKILFREKKCASWPSYACGAEIYNTPRKKKCKKTKYAEKCTFCTLFSFGEWQVNSKVPTNWYTRYIHNILAIFPINRAAGLETCTLSVLLLFFNN